MKTYNIDYSHFTNGIKNKKLKKLVEKEMEDNKHHFEEHGFALDADYIFEDVINRYFGQAIKDEICGLLCEIDEVYIEHKFQDGYVKTTAKKKNHVEVFYDSWYDKIVFRTDKDSILNFKESDGFIQLGLL
jgi:hypothetical protein